MSSTIRRQKNRAAAKRYRSHESEEQRFKRLRKAREYKERQRGDERVPNLVPEPISDDIQCEVLRRLRVTLSAEKLDECVCSVCDRFVLRDQVLLVTTVDDSFKNMCSLLNSTGLDLPEKLIQHYDCGYIYPELHGIMLSAKGILPVKEDGVARLRVCNECNGQIKKKSLPKFSIRNGFFIGELSEDLVDTTIVERMMTQLVTVVAFTRVMRGGAHRSIRSHSMAFDASPGPPATLLPSNLDQIGNYRVVVAGSITDSQLEKIRSLHIVRGKVVQSLLRYYKDNNHFYRDVQVSNEDTGNSSGCAVAEQVLDFVETASPSFVERVDEDQARVGAEDDLGTANNLEDECKMIERRMVFVKEIGNASDIVETVTELPSDSASTERRFLVRNSSKFSRDDGGCLYGMMFPHLFPFGRGHPGENRDVPVSLQACIQYYSMHSSRRFAEDDTFLLVAFDRLSTQRMFMRVSLTCQRNPIIFRGYEAITHEQLSEAICRNELHRQGRLAVNTTKPSPAERFLRSVDIGMGSLWGSNMERQRCRREAFSYQTRFGQPALFVTITPNTANSFALAQYTGITSVDSIFDCLESKLPSKAELRRAAMRNDAVSARLFMRHIDAFIEDVLAVDKKTGKAKPFPGLFGPVKAYYGMVETQGGGTLHAHFIIWLSNCPRNSDEFEHLISNETTKLKLVHAVEAYSSSIVSNTLPLSVDTQCCQSCGASYRSLESIPIPSCAFSAPKTKEDTQQPLIVRCCICKTKLSSQRILRDVLTANRPPVWPPRVYEMTQNEIYRRAELEAHCRYDLVQSINWVKKREYLHRWVDDLVSLSKRRFLLRDLSDVANLRDDPIVRLIELLPPMSDDHRLTPKDFAFMVSVLVLLLNEHWWTHTGSCFKNSRAASSPGVCRYSFPREPVLTTTFSSKGVQLCRKPAHEYINGFNPVMMAAFKSNHDIQILLGGKDVVNRIYYCCKYVTKTQHQVDSVAAVALAAFQRREEKELFEQHAGVMKSGDLQVGRKRVAALAFNLTNRQEMAGPLAALYLQRGSCAYSSSRCENLHLRHIFAQLLGDGEYSCDLVGTGNDEVQENQSTNVYRSVTTLDDYLYRPSKQHTVNLYGFCMKYFRRRRTKATREDVLFLDNHPLHATYCLGVHSRDVVPVILGPRMPTVDVCSPQEIRVMRAKIALVLFKPFRAVCDLVDCVAPTNTEWIDAYNAWENHRTDFDKTIMANMDDYYSGRIKAARDREWYGTQESENSDSDSDGSNYESPTVDPFDNAVENENENSHINDGDYDIDYDHDGNPHDTSLLNPVRYPSIQHPSKHSQGAIEAIIGNNMLKKPASRAASASFRLNESSTGSARFPGVGFLREWVKDVTSDSKVVLEENLQDLQTQSTEVLELIWDALQPENMLWNSGSVNGTSESYFPTLAAVSKEFTLNPLQHAAFCKIGIALLTRWLGMDPSQASYQGLNFEKELSRDQLLFYLGGAGGTGKSRVIDAVTRLCCGWKRSTCVLKTALTGKAATLIQGRTLASFLLSLERSLAADFVGVDMLVIDEVSMLTKADWLKLDKLLRRYKRVSGIPFGGIHIVLVGDFLQLPPVGADPIYVDPRNKKHFSTTDIEGFSLWRRFETVIVLEESVRFRDDPEWGEGCSAARLGNWSQDFIDLINSRLVTNIGKNSWSGDTVFVTPDNATRTAINNAFIQETAKQLATGQHPVRVVANFKGSLNGLSRQDVDHVMGLPDSRFGRMAPFLDLIEGMPIQVTQNVRPTKGAANGTLGFLEHLAFSPSTTFRQVRDSTTGIIVKVPSKPPQYAMLRINRGPNAVSFGSHEDTELFPVFFDAQSYAKTSISLPKAPNGDKRQLAVKLQQLPIVSAVGSTIYKVQGETLHSMVVVDWKSPIALVNKPQQTYLLVSRVVSRHAFATLSLFTNDLAAWSRPPPAALSEEQRLQEISRRTLQSFRDQFPTS